MKKRVGFLLTLLCLALALVLAVQPVLAKNPQQSSTWSAAIAYFNPTASNGELTVSYYPEGGSGFTPTQLNVNSHYSGTILVGATPGTEGSAVLSSNFNMPAIYKISSSSGDPYGVMMLEFFNSDQAGSTFYLPLVYRQGSGYVSRIGIQNIQTFAINVNLTFIRASDGSTTSYSINDIKPQSSEVFLTTDVSGLPADFNGSVMIDAGSDKVVAAVANILTSNDQIAYSYQGAVSGSTTINIPAVFCNYGRTGMNTTLHIQNVSGSPININNVTITYYDSTGSALLPGQQVNSTNIADNQRYSFTCPASGAITGKQMSARLSAPGNVVVVVETTNDQGLVAASTLSASTGSNNIVLPYVEWSSSQWDFQTTLYIMNTNSSLRSVDATFYRRDGSSVTENYSIPGYAMVEISPNTIPGLMSMENRDFKGAVMVSSSQPVAVMALVTKRFQNASGGVMFKGDSYIGMQHTP